MFNTHVFFTVENDCLGVHPPIVKDKTDSVWVGTRTEEKQVIIDAAIRKMEMCYGVKIKDLRW